MTFILSSRAMWRRWRWWSGRMRRRRTRVEVARRVTARACGLGLHAARDGTARFATSVPPTCGSTYAPRATAWACRFGLRTACGAWVCRFGLRAKRSLALCGRARAAPSFLPVFRAPSRAFLGWSIMVARRFVPRRAASSMRR